MKIITYKINDVVRNCNNRYRSERGENKNTVMFYLFIKNVIQIIVRFYFTYIEPGTSKYEVLNSVRFF